MTDRRAGMLTDIEDVRKITDEIGYKPGYRLLVEVDKADEKGRIYLQVECDRADTFTGEIGVGRGGKFYLSPYMTESEVVQGAFGLFKGYEEHETREAFTWCGRRVFGPHIDVRALWEVADTLSVREPQVSQEFRDGLEQFMDDNHEALTRLAEND